MLMHHTGPDKWISALQRCDNHLRTRKWKTNRNFLLSGIAHKHRQSFVETTQCVEHAAFQFPDERSRVRNLLDSITTIDSPLLSVTANLDLEEKGMIDYFEKDASHLLIRDPVAKRKSASGNVNEDNLAHVSETEAGENSTASGKASKKKTGSEIRCYEKAEFNKLSKEQKDKLIKIFKIHSNTKESRNHYKKIRFEEAKSYKTSVSSLMQSELDKRAKKEKHDSTKLSKAIEFIGALLEKEEADNRDSPSSIAASESNDAIK